MNASEQVQIPFCIGNGRQRGRGFGALAQVIGSSAINVLRIYIVPAAEHVVTDLLEFAVPRTANVVSCGKNFKTAPTIVGGTVWEKDWVLLAERRVQAESFQQNLQNEPVGREETLLRTFLINHVEYFSVPTFCGSFWKLWNESPSS